MWKLTKSKGAFGRANPRPLLDGAFPVVDVLGAPTPADPRATHEVLSHLAGRFSSQNSNGTKRAEDVYFGITDTPRVAESQARQRGAWVSISPRYVETLRRASALEVGFFQLTQGALELRPQEEQQLLDGARGSALAFLDVDDDPSTVEWRDQTDIWEDFLGEKSSIARAQAGVAWVMAHELSHLLIGDGGSRPDIEAIARQAQACRSLMHENVWPANPQHRAELIADHSAIPSVRQEKNGLRPIDSLVTSMRSSFMATAAIAVDGWFFDESARSKEHPSPFFRNWSLLGFWCGYLQHCREEGWGNEVPPSASDLMTVTHAVLMTEWLAGAYRDGRGGATALHDDREQVHDWLCNAAGLAPPFRFVIQLPY